MLLPFSFSDSEPGSASVGYSWGTALSVTTHLFFHGQEDWDMWEYKRALTTWTEMEGFLKCMEQEYHYEFNSLSFSV